MGSPEHLIEIAVSPAPKVSRPQRLEKRTAPASVLPQSRLAAPFNASSTASGTEFHLEGRPHVELCNLLKLAGIADSGGKGKLLVANGDVRVDGQPESRKTAKIRAGQLVDCLGQRILVSP